MSKCESKNILLISGSVGLYGTGNNIYMGWYKRPIDSVDRYVCCDCGFSEEWIRVDDILKLKKKFEE